MKRIRKWILAAGLLFMVGLSTLLFQRPYRICAALAGREYFRSTTVLMMPFPDGCATVQETPPAALIKIVEAQKTSYGLDLQRVAVCRSERRFPQSESDFMRTAFTHETQERWLPLYVGCCSYQFQRHVTVVAVQSDATGSTVLMAALVHNRWNYLRFLRGHCGENLARWL